MTERVRLRFEPLGIELTAGAGERVLDAADETPDLALPVACRAGNCGSCLLSVEAGGAVLTPPSALEAQALHSLGAARDQRLGCQISIKTDNVAGAVVVLRLP